jgi:hypothetical protein
MTRSPSTVLRAVLRPVGCLSPPITPSKSPICWKGCTSKIQPRLRPSNRKHVMKKLRRQFKKILPTVVNWKICQTVSRESFFWCTTNLPELLHTFRMRQSVIMLPHRRRFRFRPPIAELQTAVLITVVTLTIVLQTAATVMTLTIVLQTAVTSTTVTMTTMNFLPRLASVTGMPRNILNWNHRVPDARSLNASSMVMIVGTPEKSGKNGGIRTPSSAAIFDLPRQIEIVVISSTLYRMLMSSPCPFPPEGQIAAPRAVLLALLAGFLQVENASGPVALALLHLLWNLENSESLKPAASLHVGDDNAERDCSVTDRTHPHLMTTTKVITPKMMRSPMFRLTSRS